MLEYDGRLSTTGESAGHYTCDIKENVSNMWFKTNDDKIPKQIRDSDVTQFGYVVMYKRVELNIKIQIVP